MFAHEYPLHNNPLHHLSQQLHHGAAAVPPVMWPRSAAGCGPVPDMFMRSSTLSSRNSSGMLAAYSNPLVFGGSYPIDDPISARKLGTQDPVSAKGNTRSSAISEHDKLSKGSAQSGDEDNKSNADGIYSMLTVRTSRQNNVIVNKARTFQIDAICCVPPNLCEEHRAVTAAVADVPTETVSSGTEGDYRGQGTSKIIVPAKTPEKQQELPRSSREALEHQTSSLPSNKTYKGVDFLSCGHDNLRKEIPLHEEGFAKHYLAHYYGQDVEEPEEDYLSNVDDDMEEYDEFGGDLYVHEDDDDIFIYRDDPDYEAEVGDSTAVLYPSNCLSRSISYSETAEVEHLQQQQEDVGDRFNTLGCKLADTKKELCRRRKGAAYSENPDDIGKEVSKLCESPSLPLVACRDDSREVNSPSLVSLSIHPPDLGLQQEHVAGHYQSVDGDDTGHNHHRSADSYQFTLQQQQQQVHTHSHISLYKIEYAGVTFSRHLAINCVLDIQ